jgi:haloacetate dehalogenase
MASIRLADPATVNLHYVVEGSGPPLVLLHGFPESHRCWDAVARRLAARFTIVRPDLRGYGESAKPADGYSKRTMASDVLALMKSLGHERFDVAGHDRGALVGYRLALDHPAAVRRLAVMDVVPALDLWEAVNAAFAVSAYHLFLLAQPPDLPERLIGGAPQVFVDSFLDGWSLNGNAISAERRAAYHAAFATAEAIHAMCEDYRAGASVDVDHDRADRDRGRQLQCSVLVLWQQPGGAPPPFDPLEIWRRWADDVVGRGLDCGHFLPEERPEDVAAELIRFLD